MIDAFGDSQPWLVDTWRHLEGPDASIFVGRGCVSSVVRSSCVNFGGVGGGEPVPGNIPPGDLEQTYASTVNMCCERADGSFDPLEEVLPSRNRSSSQPAERIDSSLVHELGHIYTLTAGITENAAPIAIGHLYLALLRKKHHEALPFPHSKHCPPSELYADLARSTFYGYGPPLLLDGFGVYWIDCLDVGSIEEEDAIIEVVHDIGRKVFIDQEMPQWYYDTYQMSDGTIDLDKLWDDINTAFYSSRWLAIIAYNLRNEFGGYCSNELVRQFTTGTSAPGQKAPLVLETPWVDAGNSQAS